MFLWRSKDPVIEGVMTIQGIGDKSLGSIPHFPSFFELQHMQVYLK